MIPFRLFGSLPEFLELWDDASNKRSTATVGFLLPSLRASAIEPRFQFTECCRFAVTTTKHPVVRSTPDECRKGTTRTTQALVLQCLPGLSSGLKLEICHFNPIIR